MELTKDNNVVGNVMNANCELKVYGTSYLSLIYSDDDGATWSKPVDINSDIKADWMKFLGTGPGSGIQIKNGEYAGRIVFPVYYTNGAGKQSSAVIYSDDHGETWNMGESPNDGRDLGNGSFGNSQTMTDGLELTECQVVEMPNGQLKLFMRNTGSYVRIATSFDGGATWDSEVYEDKNLPEPYCQLSVINYSKKIDGQDAIVFANPKGAGRTNGTVRFGIIEQNGTHSNGEPRYEFEWRYNKLVKAGTYAYSCLTELPNSNIGLFYEGTDNKEMSYMEMSPEYIKFDYESAVEELVNPGKIESIELLDGKNSYNPGDKITVKLSFDQAVSLIGNKSLTLRVGDSKVSLNPVSDGNAREFKFEGTLPTTLSEGRFNLVLEGNSDIEILNTVGKNTTLNEDIELGNIIIINKVIDKSELENLINSANELIKEKYTEDSWSNLEAILQEANKVFVDENAIQDEVNEMVDKLQQAISELEEKKIDKSVLQGLVDKRKETDSSKYIPSTWIQFENALKAANSILINESSTQEEVESSYNTLLKAYLELRLAPDKSLLEELIKDFESIDLSKYTDKSVKILKKALEDANKVLDNEEVTEKEVNTALENLKNAKNSLVASSDSNTNLGQSSNSSTNNSSSGNSITGKLPQTGTAGVAVSLISAITALLGGIGLSRKKKN